MFWNKIKFNRKTKLKAWLYGIAELSSDGVAAVFRFFIRRNPLVFALWLKNSAKDRNTEKFQKFSADFNYRHPYFSTASSMVVITAILAGAVFLIFPKQKASAWFDENWHFRKSIDITNDTTEESNVYVSLTLDTSNTAKFQTDCEDLRFTKYNGELMPYYVVSDCGTDHTVVHVNFDTFPAGRQTIYEYYGNPMAPNGFSASDFSTPATDYTVGSSGTEEKSPAPSAYWTFDEGQGTTAHDESSNRNDGTLTNMSATASPTSGWQTEDNCISGKCLVFDGTDDYITAGTNDNLNPSVITVSAWIKTNMPVDATYTHGIVSRMQQSGSYLGYELGIYNGTSNAYFHVGGYYVGNVLVGNKAVNDNKWHLITGIYDGTNAYLYVDGLYDNSGVCTNNMAAPGEPLDIGTAYARNPSQAFNGRIDEPKIYPYARTPQQIKEDYNSGMAGMGASTGSASAFGGKSDKWLTDGLVGYWKMDESTGTVVQDYSGNSNTGNWLGSGTHPASGKFGNGGGFNGTDDTINAGSNSSLDDIQNQGGGGMTVAFWIKSGTNSSSYIMTKGNGGGDSGTWGIMQNGSGNTGRLSFDKEGATDKNWEWNSVLTAGTWQYVVITWDGTMANSGVKAYINSSQLAGSTTSDGVSPNSDSAYSLRLGSLNGTGSYADIKMDDVRIYNRALSPDEVQKLYNWAPGPIAHWKMDEKVSGNTQTILDDSGNGNNGTTVDGANNAGMNCSVPGKFGTGCQFDGVDDYVELASNPLSSFSASSISMWVKLSDLLIGGNSYSQTFVNLYADSSNYLRIGQDEDAPGRIFVSYNSGGSAYGRQTDAGKIAAGNWYHIVYTFDGSNRHIYVNGIASDTGANSYSAGNRSIIGARSTTDGATRGQIDDVRVYDYARSQSQIIEDMQNGSHDPLVYYNFNEGVGSTVYNSGFGGTALNGNLGTGSSAPSWSNDGKFGKGLSFDGNDYVSVPDFGY